jgi:acyl carrier protein
MKGKLRMINEVMEFICKYEGFNSEEITPVSNLKNDLGLTSLELFDLLNAMEKRFDIKYVSNDDIANIETIEDIVFYIEKNRSNSVV